MNMRKGTIVFEFKSNKCERSEKNLLLGFVKVPIAGFLTLNKLIFIQKISECIYEKRIGAYYFSRILTAVP